MGLPQRVLPARLIAPLDNAILIFTIHTPSCGQLISGQGIASVSMNILEFSVLVGLGSHARRISRRVDGAGRRCRRGSHARAAVSCGHPLRHRRIAGFGDRHLIGRSRGLCARRLLQHPHRHVSGDGNHGGRDCGSRNCPARIRQRHRRRVWRWCCCTRLFCRAEVGWNMARTCHPQPWPPG